MEYKYRSNKDLYSNGKNIEVQKFNKKSLLRRILVSMNSK